MLGQVIPDQPQELETDSLAPRTGPAPVVAIVGRPNVGKSSLFNRILARRNAIVSEEAGTTRDRLIAEVEWSDRRLILVDTGGLEADPQGPIRKMVQEQADMALAGADLIVFMTSATEGLTATDELLADRLRLAKKPLILAVNKVDNDAREFSASEFYRLGIAQTVLISAYHNFGVYELMDQVLSLLPEEPAQEASEETVEEDLRLSIVGRTNVGKSLLVNAILGQERSIVSEIAGTTRDALDTPFTYNEQPMTLIDTAGIRRPGRVERGIEYYSVLRAVNAVNRSHITCLVTDAGQLATMQDAHIAGLAWDMCRGLIVVVNKWDLMLETRRYS
ncbi:MAG: ribosome biogenesis GTPase Der, partial [Stenotrophomonas maltophilia]